MFKRKKKTGCETPNFRKPTVPPQYNPPPMPPVKEPKLSATSNCTYETPCGWCTRWDKRCDRQTGCDVSNIQQPKITIEDCLMRPSVVQEIIDKVIAEKFDYKENDK